MKAKKLMIDNTLKYNKGLDILKQSTFRITKQRKDLLAYLSKFETTYIPVTEVDAYMQKLYPNASHTTTYRNIKEFSDLGIIEQRTEDGQLNVKFQCDFVTPHHGHFFCQNCHRVIKLDATLAPKLQADLAQFVVLTVKLEIFGLCDNCQKNQAS